MYKSIVAFLAITIGCLSNPAHAGGITERDMAKCMSAAGNMPPAVSFDYCRAALSALNYGYSFEDAIQIGVNHIVMKYGSTSVVPSMINSTNPFASSTFQWNDPGSIYD